MTIYCTQDGCNFIPKVAHRTLTGTNNYKIYYKNKHPEIPHTKEQAKALADKKAGLKDKKPFFKNAASEQSYNERGLLPDSDNEEEMVFDKNRVRIQVVALVAPVAPTVIITIE